MNDLAEKLSKLLKDASKDRDDLLNKLMQESNSLKKMMGLPLSIYFCAYRTEDYETGGEEYLTFTGKICIIHCHEKVFTCLNFWVQPFLKNQWFGKTETIFHFSLNHTKFGKVKNFWWQY